MGKVVDLTGKKFGRLTVMGFDVNNQYRARYWNCICDCGENKVVRGSHLTSAATVSCGCYKIDQHYTHGETNSPTYRSWASLLQRCLNPKNEYYYRYGGRGIKVCDRWKDFSKFLEDMGTRPDGMSIDRKNNNGNYERSNCRWATRKEQDNNKSTSRFLTYKGETKTVQQWSELLGVSHLTLRARLNYGWTVEKTLTTKVQQRRTV